MLGVNEVIRVFLSHPESIDPGGAPISVLVWQTEGRRTIFWVALSKVESSASNDYCVWFLSFTSVAGVPTHVCGLSTASYATPYYRTNPWNLAQ